MPFGIFIVCNLTAESIYSILATFIKVCGSPRTFINFENSQIATALERLKDENIFNGIHILDSLDVIKNISYIPK